MSAIQIIAGEYVDGEVRRYQDEIEAWQAARQWFEKFATGATSVERWGLRFDDPTAHPLGGVMAVWRMSKLVGIATVVRDDANFSILAIIRNRGPARRR